MKGNPFNLALYQKGVQRGVELVRSSRHESARALLHTLAVDLVPVDKFEELQDRYPVLTNEMTVEELLSVVLAHKAIFKEDVKAYEALINNAYPALKQDQNTTNYNFTTNLHITDVNPIK